MERYDYYDAVRENVAEYIKENIDLSEWTDKKDELYGFLNEELWDDDSVTGNASGSRFCNAWIAEECLLHNGELYKEAAREFAVPIEDFCNNPELADVSIRCYVLSECISDVISKLDFPESEELPDPDDDFSEEPVDIKSLIF